MRVVVAGIYRSGSTWMFNAVRLLLESEGYEVNGFFRGEGDWTEDWETDKANVLKVHAFYPYLVKEAEYVITTYRPYEDIVESMKKQREIGVKPQFENAGAHEDIAEFLSWLAQWNVVSDYCMEFDDLIKRPLKVLRKLKIALELKKANVNKVAEQLRELKPPKEGGDELTMLTNTHTAGYEQRKSS